MRIFRHIKKRREIAFYKREYRALRLLLFTKGIKPSSLDNDFDIFKNFY